MPKPKTTLLLVPLLATIISLSFAQQNQISQKPNPEVETLKIQLQTVQNEKIELTAKLLDAQAKLADSNAKLANAEFGKFERELRDSNNEWLRAWGLGFLTILGVFVAILLGVSYVFWFWLRSRADQLMADRVEMSIDGFKEAVAQQEVIKNQIRILEKEHSASMLENLMTFYPGYAPPYSEQIKALREEALLDVFGDEIYHLKVRCKAVEVLADRKSTQLVSPVISFLNSVADSDLYTKPGFETQSLLRTLVSSLAYIHTPETYEGLAEFLNRLITKNPKHRDMFLTVTVFSFAWVSVELDRKDSVSVLKEAIPFLIVALYGDDALRNLAGHFDKLNEPEGIKKILTNGLTDNMPDVETQCLELLQKHDPDFVREWQMQKESANTQTKEPS